MNSIKLWLLSCLLVTVRIGYNMEIHLKHSNRTYKLKDDCISGNVVFAVAFGGGKGHHK